MLLLTPHDLGAVLRDRRRQLGLDQAELAQRVGVSRKWVSEAERGNPGASIGLILNALAALGTSLTTTQCDGPADRPEPIEALDIDDIVDAHRRGKP